MCYGMPPEARLKALTHSVIGIALIAMLLVLLIGLRREANGGEPVRRMVHFGLVVWRSAGSLCR